MGTLDDGRCVTRWDLRAPSGAGLELMDLGATILSLQVPDRQGKLEDVVLGFDTPSEYLTSDFYFGAVIGRFANRIAGGALMIDGRRFALRRNEGCNTLHGGIIGFSRRLWEGERVETGGGLAVCFNLVSADGEEGFPGTVRVSVTYRWTNDSRLVVDYRASSDKPTPLNLTQHSYWNLAGADSKVDTLDHELMINGDKYLPIDRALLPTGEIDPVAATPFDFRDGKTIGKDIKARSEQIRLGCGFDHSWVINGSAMRVAAVLYDPRSGRRMTVTTDQPGLQFYSGNHLEGTVGKNGTRYRNHHGLALETQAFPDSPNRPNFPDAILRPERQFVSRTIFSFGADPIDQG